MTPLLSIEEVAKVIGVGRTTVYNLINAGQLRRMKVGNRTLIRQQDINEFISGELTMKETMMSAKLAQAGIIPRDVKFQLAIAEFQNNGGEYGTALAMLDAAYKMGSEGRLIRADEAGHELPAAPLQNDDDEGREIRADKADRDLPLSSSPERSAGQNRNADKAMSSPPAAAAKPGHARRGGVAIGAVQAAISKSLWDTTLLPDGRRLREVRWSECPSLAGKYRRLSRILMAIHNVAVPADPNATIDNLVNEDGLKEIVSTVEKFNDLH